MDLVTIMAGVLLGNMITFSFLWHLKKLDSEKPPMRNVLAILFTLLVVFLIGLAVSGSGQAGL